MRIAAPMAAVILLSVCLGPASAPAQVAAANPYEG